MIRKATDQISNKSEKNLETRERSASEATLEKDLQAIESDIEESMEFVQKSIFMELAEDDISRSINFGPALT